MMLEKRFFTKITIQHYITIGPMFLTMLIFTFLRRHKENPPFVIAYLVLFLILYMIFSFHILFQNRIKDLGALEGYIPHLEKKD